MGLYVFADPVSSAWIVETSGNENNDEGMVELSDAERGLPF